MNADASKKNEAESKCPPACAPFTWGCNNPQAHGTCITQAKVSESICFSDCAKIKVQQAAKDHVDSAQEAVKDAAKGATVNSLVNNAKDHLDSAQEIVKDAAKGATVNSLVKSRGKCMAALKPCYEVWEKMAQQNQNFKTWIPKTLQNLPRSA